MEERTMSTLRFSAYRISLLAGLTLVSSPAWAGDLTVVSNGGVIQDVQREIYFKPFMEQTKIKLIEDTWEGGVGVLRTKIEGGNNNWDVVIVEAEEAVVGCDEGLLEKLDWSKIGGKERYLPAAVSDCAVGTDTFNHVLSYDGDRIKDADAPKNWADFWDLKKWPGKRGLRNGPKSTLEIALMADGVPPAEVYKTLATPAGVDRAFKKLDAIKPAILWWDKAGQTSEWLASGEAPLVVSLNGRISNVNRTEHKNFKMVWTNSVYTMDNWAIMKGSKNIKEAEAFLEFAGRAEQQKLMPLKMSLGITNAQAANGLDKAQFPDIPSLPEHMATALQLDDKFWLENIDKLTQRFNVWAAK